MSRELIEAKQQLGDAINELAERSKELAATQSELEDRNRTIETLQQQLADGGENRRDVERKLRDTEQSAKGLQARIDAMNGTIKSLEKETESLRKQLDSANPALQEELRQEAEELKRKDEKRVRMTAFKAGLAKRFGIATIVAVVTVLVFAFLRLFEIPVSEFLWGAVPVVLFVTALVAKEIKNLVETYIWPTLTKYWQAAGVITGLIIGALIASFGIDFSDPVWLRIFAWLGTTVGYGAVFHGLIEGLHATAAENPTENNYRPVIGVGVMASIMGGIILTAINPMGWVITPLRFLLHILGGTIACGITLFAAAVIGWVGVRIFATLPGLWERQIKGSRGVDIWLRRARGLTVIASILVGVIVGMSLWPQNGENISSYFIAAAMGIVLAIAFFLVEGKILEACFLRKFHNGRLITLMLMGVLFASLTGYLTFSKLYSMGSSSQRFKATQGELVKVENAYLSATEATAIAFAEEAETEAERIKYTSAVTEMRDSVRLASQARDYHDLETSVSTFVAAGGKVTDTLNRDKQGLLETVRLPSQPNPIELGAQVLFGWEVEGVGEVYGGAVFMSACATLVVDYLISLFAFFGWIISGKRRKNETEGEEGEPGWGRIISVDNGKVLIDLGQDHGIQAQDSFTVYDDSGTSVTNLETENPVGGTAFMCRVVGKPSRDIKPKMKICIVN